MMIGTGIWTRYVPFSVVRTVFGYHTEYIHRVVIPRRYRDADRWDAKTGAEKVATIKAALSQGVKPTEEALSKHLGVPGIRFRSILSAIKWGLV